jgi:hypothetical protein
LSEGFVASACMGVLVWWLEDDVASSAEEVHSAFRRMATQGVKRYVTSA